MKDRVYIGFVDGKPLREPYDPYGVRMIPVFTSRRAARKCFQDVRTFILVAEKSQKDRKATGG